MEDFGNSRRPGPFTSVARSGASTIGVVRPSALCAPGTVERRALLLHSRFLEQNGLMLLLQREYVSGRRRTGGLLRGEGLQLGGKDLIVLLHRCQQTVERFAAVGN
jgi:hypothetical protein